MPPDEPSPESEKDAKAEPKAADAEPANPADKGKDKDKVPAAPAPGSDRTRTIVMMVLATLALTAVFTLISESIFKPKNTAPSANAVSTETAPTSSTKIITLPMASSGVIILVSVTFDHIEVDGIEVEKIGPLIASQQTGNLGKLQAVMDQKRGPSSVGGKVALSIEQGVPRNVIKSVMGTLALAGYRDVHLVNALADGGLEGGRPAVTD